MFLREHSPSDDKAGAEAQLWQLAHLEGDDQQPPLTGLSWQARAGSRRPLAVTVSQLHSTMGNQAVKRLVAGRNQRQDQARSENKTGLASPLPTIQYLPVPPGATQRRDVVFYYQTVDPNDWPHFPSLGETSLTHIPKPPSLQVSERFSTLSLEGVDDYDSEQNDTKVVGAGEKDIGMAVKRPDGWRAEFEKYATGVKKIEWEPEEPSGGAYRFYIGITKADAEKIAEFEKEHRDDFALAWELTLGKMRAIVVDFFLEARDTSKSLIGQFVDYLIGREVKWLIPMHPEQIDSWGQHLLSQFVALAGKSKDRDTTNQHNPTGYRVEVSKDAASKKGKMVLYFTMGGFQPSSDYIKATDLPVPFTADSYEAYMTASKAKKEQLSPGSAVTVTKNIPIDIYQEADRNSTAFTDALAVKEGVKEATVERAVGDTQVWLKIPAKGEVSGFFKNGFVLVGIADLEPRQ